MIQAILWGTIAAFILMLSGIGLQVLSAGRPKVDRVRNTTLLYLVLLALWMLAYAYLYFAILYEGLSFPMLITIFALIRMVVSVLCAYLLPSAILQSLGYPLNRKNTILLALFPALLIPSVIYLLWNPVILYSDIISGGYYLYLFGFCLTYIVRTEPEEHRRDPLLSTICKLSIIFSFLFIIDYVLISSALPTDPPVATDAPIRALYGMSLGFMVIRQALQSGSAAQEGSLLPVDFISSYRITEREQAVILQVLKGYTNSQSAENLFISVKTVETHISSIYRKCGVKNRMELSNLIANHSS